MDGNQMKMREVLVKLLDAIKSLSRNHNDDIPNDVCAILGMMAFEANAALSEPARQCDVGTEEEQGERQKAYCRKHFTPDNLGGNCRKCPLKNRKGWSCQIAWAQLPYEAEKGVSK